MSIQLKNGITIDKNVLIERLREDGLLEDDDLVFVAGSLIESIVNLDYSKMGNSLSDIDVFIIKNKELNLEKIHSGDSYVKNNVITVFRNYDNLGYDIEIYTMKCVQNLINAVNSIELHKDVKTQNSFKVDSSWTEPLVASFLNRLNYSMAVNKIEQYYRLKDSINYQKYKMYRIQKLMNEIDNIIVDVYGNLTEEMYEVSLYLTREAYINFMKMILVYEGQTIDRDKWVIYKFSRLAELMQQYQEYENVYQQLFLAAINGFEKGKEIIQMTIDSMNNFFAEMEV